MTAHNKTEQKNGPTGWTKTFIKDMCELCNRDFVKVDYYFTKDLTGHGVFVEFLFIIKKADRPICWYWQITQASCAQKQLQ